jgi:hypothetical protein
MINGVFIGGVNPSSTYSSYKAVFGEKSKAFEKFENSKAVQKAVADFKERIKTVKDVEELLKDRKLTEFVLSAYSLDDEIKYPGRLKKILTEPVGDKASLVNKLIDPRYKEMAKDLGIAELEGTGKLKFSFFVDALAKKFVTNEFEKKLGELDPALREAAYFKRNAGKITKVLDILGDKVFRSVVTSALKIPPQAAIQTIERQMQLVTDKIDPKKFQDPAFVDKFLQKFLIMNDAKGGTSGGALSGKNAALIPLLEGAGGSNSLVNIVV